jgi:hypothetical protein
MNRRALGRHIRRGWLAVLLGGIAGEVGAQGSIRGYLVDSLRAGGPVAGAEVVLMGAQRRATTERDGGFAFADVPEGRYTVAYWAPWLDSLGMPAIQREVQVRNGRTEAVSLATPSQRSIQLAVCGEALGAEQGILIGELRDAEGSPAAGVGIYARWLETVVQGTQVAQGTMAAVDTATAAGSYVLCGVPVGTEFSLRALGPNGIASGELVVEAKTALERRDLIVGPATGAVRVSGRIVTPAGEPLPNASVLVAGDSSRRVVTDAEGRFVLDGVPRRSSQLVVRALGYVPALEVVTPFDGEWPLDDLALEKLPQELAAVVVNGGPMSAAQAQFETRRASGRGTYIGDAEIAKLVQPNAQTISQMAPRTAVQQTRQGPMLMMRRGSEFCRPRFFIDGYDFRNIDVDEEANFFRIAKRVEIYTANDSPPQFNDFNGCGSVVIWTS